MKRIVCFGEIMMRLNPPDHQRITQADCFCATYAGGEANVAASLAAFGQKASFVTKLPQNDLGEACLSAVRAVGIDTQHILRGGKRLGLYFVEKGASQRPSKVIYDRADSAIATADPSEFHWDETLRGADWFHFTGITPALGENVQQMCLDACRYCREHGITVSCDLNYRNKLWTTKQAEKVMSELCQYVDICFANEEDAAQVFGIKAAETDVTAGQVDHASYCQVAKKLQERFKFRMVAITLRSSISADDNRWAAMCFDGGNFYFSKEYLIHIVDRVGAGDSFCGGLIYALLERYAPQQAIEFAAAASCLKHTIEGDFNRVSVQEVCSLVAGNASGRVQR